MKVINLRKIKLKNIPKEFLIQEYIKNKKSGRDIAKKLKCHYISIYRLLRKYNIPIRQLQKQIQEIPN